LRPMSDCFGSIMITIQCNFLKRIERL